MSSSRVLRRGHRAPAVARRQPEPVAHARGGADLTPRSLRFPHESLELRDPVPDRVHLFQLRRGEPAAAAAPSAEPGGGAGAGAGRRRPPSRRRPPASHAPREGLPRNTVARETRRARPRLFRFLERRLPRGRPRRTPPSAPPPCAPGVRARPPRLRRERVGEPTAPALPMDSIEPAARAARARYRSVGSRAVGAGAQLAAAAARGGGGRAGITTDLFLSVGLETWCAFSSLVSSDRRGSRPARRPVRKRLGDAGNVERTIHRSAAREPFGESPFGVPSASASGHPAAGFGAGFASSGRRTTPRTTHRGSSRGLGRRVTRGAWLRRLDRRRARPQLHQTRRRHAAAAPERSPRPSGPRGRGCPSSPRCACRRSPRCPRRRSRGSPRPRARPSTRRAWSRRAGRVHPRESTAGATRRASRSPSRYRNTARSRASRACRAPRPSASSGTTRRPCGNTTPTTAADSGARSRRPPSVFSSTRVCRICFSLARDRRRRASRLRRSRRRPACPWYASPPPWRPPRRAHARIGVHLFASRTREGVRGFPRRRACRRAARASPPRDAASLTRCPAPRASRVTAPARNALVRIRGGRSRTRECGRPRATLFTTPSNTRVALFVSFRVQSEQRAAVLVVRLVSSTACRSACR